jgi:hypothetical protein
MTDFGADVAFGRIPKKLKEHYGIEVPLSSARNITEAHARKIREMESLETQIPEHTGVSCLVGEMDGTMIPIVTTCASKGDGEPVDRRKTRQVDWREARLSLARSQGSVNAVYGATFLGGVEDAGNQMAHCAIRAGAGENTEIHCVGDGAPWIADQVERVFGLQATYLIDFYHLCEYMEAAAERIMPAGKQGWLAEQKQRLRESKLSEVIAALEPYIEPDSIPREQAHVRACYRYITNRQDQFDYKEALARDLPIGSGAVESAHQYVIQDRLKLAGAWWTDVNAHNMLALRTLRANEEWESYWEGVDQKAA